MPVHYRPYKKENVEAKKVVVEVVPHKQLEPVAPASKPKKPARKPKKFSSDDFDF